MLQIILNVTRQKEIENIKDGLNKIENRMTNMAYISLEAKKGIIDKMKYVNI